MTTSKETEWMNHPRLRKLVMAINELTLAELKRLDASKGRGQRSEIPTLREVLELVDGRAGINVEIKNMPGERSFDSPVEAAAEAAVRLLDDVGFTGPALCCSFNWLSIERVQVGRELRP